MRGERLRWRLPLSGKGLEDLVSPVGVLFTDQLLLCPWQSLHSATDKGEFREKLKQSKILFPLKISCVLVVPWRMHLFWHLVPCGISRSPSSQSTKRVWKVLLASWLSWAEDADAHQLFSRYKESVNFPSCTTQNCWPCASLCPLLPPARCCSCRGGRRVFRVLPVQWFWMSTYSLLLVWWGGSLASD